MRINGFAAHFDEIFAGIFCRLPKPRIGKTRFGWACASPSVLVIGEPTPAAAYARWKRGWLQLEAQRSPQNRNQQDVTA